MHLESRDGAIRLDVDHKSRMQFLTIARKRSEEDQSLIMATISGPSSLEVFEYSKGALADYEYREIFASEDLKVAC